MKSKRKSKESDIRNGLSLLIAMSKLAQRNPIICSTPGCNHANVNSQHPMPTLEVNNE